MRFAVLLFSGVALHAETAQEFYSAYQKLKVVGLPNKAQMAKLAPYLSASLRKAIDNAQTLQASCMKKHPDEKPMWIEGSLFTSNFEGFMSFQAAPAQKGRASISFSYADRGQTFRWKDEVAFVTEKGRAVVDDVLYGRTEGFTSGFGASLKRSLTGVKSCD